MYTEEPNGEVVPYGEFVGLARDEGLVALDVQVVQAPSEGNGRTAVVVATARTATASFGAVGEASPPSAPPAWHPFLTTLAELRAKARALRELTGLEHAVREEFHVPYLGLDENEAEELPRQPIAPSQHAAAAASAAVPQRAAASTAPSQRTAPTSAPSAGPPSSPAAARPPSYPVPADEDEEAMETEETGEEEDGSGEAIDEEDEEEPGADEVVPRPAIPVRPAQTTAAAAPRRADLPPDYEGIDGETMAKLKRLAFSIAELEGAHPSDAEVVQRLDRYFLGNFKRPLNRASRLDGQAALRRLSMLLRQRREAATGNGSRDDG